MTILLEPDGQGGYRSADGRWIVRPEVVALSSSGRKRWYLTDTTGRASLRMAVTRKSRSSAWVNSLDMVRNLIEQTERIEK
jgi:hypothetical protein